MTNESTSPIVAAEEANTKSELELLAAQEEDLAKAQAAIDAKKQALAARATAPRDPHALGLKARDAILGLLAHRNGESEATKPERDAWQALAAFFDSLGN